MSDFKRIDLSGNAPAGICPECAAQGVLHTTTGTELIYCKCRLRGCYRAQGREWHVIAGIERGHFLDMAARGINAGELRIGIVCDLIEIIEADAAASTQH